MRLHPQGPSQCFVLIKQSGSLSLRQFLASCVGGEPRGGSLRPAPRASPFPEVSDLFCRIPLPALLHSARGCAPWRPDAVWVRTEPAAPGFSGATADAPNAREGAFARGPALLRATRFQAGLPRWGDERALLAVCRGVSERRRVAARGPWSWNFNQIPFRPLRTRARRNCPRP